MAQSRRAALFDECQLLGGNSGKHMLVLSPSQLDPERTIGSQRLGSIVGLFSAASPSQSVRL
jgi:hypothetical protein